MVLSYRRASISASTALATCGLGQSSVRSTVAVVRLAFLSLVERAAASGRSGPG
jgi:hypothetical protein